MKRIITLFSALIITAFFASTFSVFAAVLPLRVVVDGDKITFPDAQPFVDANQRTQIPIRFVSEALGAKVVWDGKNKSATITHNGKKLVIYIGKKTYELDGQTKQMDTEALFNDTRTFVPLRFVSEGLGVSVNWDDAVKTVYISTKSTVEPSTGEKEAVVHGFKIKYVEMGDNIDPVYVTSSKLRVSENEYKGKDRAIMNIEIGFTKRGADPVTATNEAEAILRQKVESGVVDDIMKYVRTKTKVENILKTKFFTDSKYEISVISPENDGIGITIFLK
ncbi:hypothetical protein FHS15_002639 [Paenibacillus castaneae]|uniref:copper amine oxidase N-terminal domain-containing protein n=1 Tax=Paenibacillus castaneae TaxID=474957 RepID=UPI000C9C9545|nr:copper amine oxidase N-terminal domain-containing protein [Paenibacillus castaneae]NIK77503.1 hypothetical protein [Paenibacillus castaneae]